MAQQSPAGPAAHSFGLPSADVVPIVAVLAAVASGLSGQQPTGNVVADFVFSAGFGVGLVWLSQYARPDSLVISAVLALFFTAFRLPFVLVAAVAAASAVFITSGRRLDRESWLIGAAVTAALVSQVVLNLPSFRFVGSASILAAIAIAPIVLSGLRGLPGRRRRMLLGGLAAALIFALVAGGLALATAFSARDTVEVGIEQAQDGVAAIEAGNQDRAVALLDAARQNFDIASDRLSGPATWPARFVPVVAQHSRALETAANEGSALARTAVRTVTSADVEQIRGQNGTIDLDLVRALNVELTSAALVLDDAQRSLLDVRTAWLLPQLDRRISSVQAELAATAEDIGLAAEATTVVPDILGGDGERRYLVLFVQPSEAREFGGFVGAFGLLEIEDGRLDLVDSGSMREIGPAPATFTDPQDFPASYLQIGPETFGQNLTGIADLSTIAAAARDFVPQWRVDPDFTIDGVITIDPYALAAMLELTGPIQIPSRVQPLDETNVVEYLLREQYLEFEDEGREERQEVLDELAEATFERLLRIEVPGPERLGAIFGPIARANRIGFATFDERENAFLEQVLLSADMPQVGQAVEMLGVYNATAIASKLDAYSTRNMTYTVDVDPASGAISGVMEVEISNEAPADAPGYVLGSAARDLVSIGDGLEVGDNLVAVSVYTRSDIVELASPDAVFEVDDTVEALGYDRHAIVIEIPRGTSRSVTFQTQSVVPPGRYDLLVTSQQSANIGEFTLIVRPASGWRVVAADTAPDGSWTTTVPLDNNRGFSLIFEQKR